MSKQKILDGMEELESNVSHRYKMFLIASGNARKVIEEKDEGEMYKPEARDLLQGTLEKLLDLHEASLDAAQEVRSIQGGGLLDDIDPDVGKPGAHDAYYAKKAAERQYAREVSWPLNLSDWKKEEIGINMPEPSPDPVTAEGNKKYTRKMVDNTKVYLVVDERDVQY